MPRMRTAKQVLEIIREEDPGSAISLTFIRNLINSGKLPVVCAGKKKLVNVDTVLAYLAKGEQLEPEPQPEYGCIREVPLRVGW